jgi:hypothetical protein
MTTNDEIIYVLIKILRRLHLPHEIQFCVVFLCLTCCEEVEIKIDILQCWKIIFTVEWRWREKMKFPRKLKRIKNNNFYCNFIGFLIVLWLFLSIFKLFSMMFRWKPSKKSQKKTDNCGFPPQRSLHSISTSSSSSHFQWITLHLKLHKKATRIFFSFCLNVVFFPIHS